MYDSCDIIGAANSISKLGILMTCIVAITDDDYVYIGGERAAADTSTIVSMTTPKIFKKGNWVMGYSGTIGIGQLIEFIDFAEEVEDPYTYIRLTIVEDMKNAYESFTNPPAERDTTWLIGYKNRLFEMSDTDWSVIEVKETALGSGGNYALGSLYTSIDKTPIERIVYAVGAAITYSPNCQGPIDILSTDITKEL